MQSEELSIKFKKRKKYIQAVNKRNARIFEILIQINEKFYKNNLNISKWKTFEWL